MTTLPIGAMPSTGMSSMRSVGHGSNAALEAGWLMTDAWIARSISSFRCCARFATCLDGARYRRCAFGEREASARCCPRSRSSAEQLDLALLRDRRFGDRGLPDAQMLQPPTEPCARTMPAQINSSSFANSVIGSRQSSSGSKTVMMLSSPSQVICSLSLSVVNCTMRKAGVSMTTCAGPNSSS